MTNLRQHLQQFILPVVKNTIDYNRYYIQYIILNIFANKDYITCRLFTQFIYLIHHKLENGKASEWILIVSLLAFTSSADVLHSNMWHANVGALSSSMVLGRVRVMNPNSLQRRILHFIQTSTQQWNLKDLLTAFWLFSAMPALITTTNINSIVFGEWNSQITSFWQSTTKFANHRKILRRFSSCWLMTKRVCAD